MWLNMPNKIWVGNSEDASIIRQRPRTARRSCGICLTLISCIYHHHWLRKGHGSVWRRAIHGNTDDCGRCQQGPHGIPWQLRAGDRIQHMPYQFFKIWLSNASNKDPSSSASQFPTVTIYPWISHVSVLRLWIASTCLWQLVRIYKNNI